MKKPFFLFPGLACNERLFAAQKYGLNNILKVIIPEWIRPTGKDQLETFALRWAADVWETYYSENALPENRLNPADGCYVGGHSFGGMVAPIAGEFFEKKGIPVYGCFRFASASTPEEIPEKWLILGRMLNVFPDGAWLTIKTFCYLKLIFPLQKLTPLKEELYLQIVESPVRRSFHIVRMLYSWKGMEEKKYDFPVICIRGTNDSVLPSRNVSKDVILLPHAGHGMMMTQGAKLNDLIRNFIFANS